ncbi:hypothetical protein AB870_18315 [Pandoraea faecigallinarum]|nr:hypothetical protein [Pandoraea faecigallinarum]AKM31654.3 hypothetical protein AB870_18315 [Pandoraea faecigallinarum]
MLSPHEIATLLLAAASLGPIDADALESPDLAALAQARLVDVAVDKGQTKVSVTEDGHRVLQRLGLERSGGERVKAPRLSMRPTGSVGHEMRSPAAGQMEVAGAPRQAASGRTSGRVQDASGLEQAAALPADASEGREKQA